jgi:hypothetical protein
MSSSSSEASALEQLQKDLLEKEQLIQSLLAEQNEEGTIRKDVDGDGKDDTIVTKITKVDVDGDEIDDITTTTVVATNDAGDVIASLTDIDSIAVDVSLSNSTVYTGVSESSALLLEQIHNLQGQIKCSKTQHLGTMEDYSELFRKYRQYTSEVGEGGIDLTLDISDLTSFADQADNFSKIFETVSLSFERISTVDDSKVLLKIKEELERITKMYDNIRKFKQVITTNNVLQMPVSIVKVTEELAIVQDSIDCSLKFLNRFGDKGFELDEEHNQLAQLNDVDKAAIKAAERALDVWLDMIHNEAAVTMGTNSLIQLFREKLAGFKSRTAGLKAVTDQVEAKLAQWKSGVF